MMSKNFNSVLKNMDSLNFVAAEKLHYLSNYFWSSSGVAL